MSFFLAHLTEVSGQSYSTQIKIFSHRHQLQQGGIWLKFELIQDVMVILVSFKNEEDPIKIEGASVAIIQNIDFSNTKGQTTPQSEVGSLTAEIL